MRRRVPLLVPTLVPLLVVVSGCLNGGTDCPGDPTRRRFDPDLGACVEIGDDEACQACATGPGPCVVGSSEDLTVCGGPCAAADEATCVAQLECVAAYVDGRFASCWSTAPSGPIHTGACAGLDAHACTRHDNCALSYLRAANGALTFDRCIDEPVASAR